MIAFLRARGVVGAVQDAWFEPCEEDEVWSRMLRNLLQQLTQRPDRQGSTTVSTTMATAPYVTRVGGVAQSRIQRR